jgi:hypothetical protein
MNIFLGLQYAKEVREMNPKLYVMMSLEHWTIDTFCFALRSKILYHLGTWDYDNRE